MNKAIVLLLLACTTIGSVAQQVAPLPKEGAEKIRLQVQSLAAGAHFAIFPLRGKEEFGDLISNDQDGFRFHNVDRNVDVALRYVEVRKIRTRYGGYNSVQGRHTDRVRAYLGVERLWLRLRR